jgi:DnaJ homolog subfamily A member 5
MMEKENKRVREEATHEFNDCVRSLVAFIRKRDPRHKYNVRGEAERQRILRDAASAQAARSRAANRVNVAQEREVPVWRREVERSEIVQTDEEVDEVEDEFHCVACNKTFKSEKHYESHERSKKHIKAVNRISWAMKHEHNTLGLGRDLNSVVFDSYGPGIAKSAAQVRKGTGEHCQDDLRSKVLLGNVTDLENHLENVINDTCY